MSSAGNADKVLKHPRGALKALTSIIAWILAYSITFALFQHMLQIARTVSPYIGYEVPLTVVSLYVSSLTVLIGLIITYILRPSKTVANLILATSITFVIFHYTYIYSVISNRLSRLRVEVLPFLIKYVSSSGHESIAIDLGQFVIAAIIIYSALRFRGMRRGRH